jgi:HD-GYP domain-containing protein (c-di-GMP phosphodiesterase class II)
MKNQFNAIKQILNKLITPVPPELKEQFDSLQLKNSIFRLRILTLIEGIAVLVSIITYLLTTEQIKIEYFYEFSDFSELIIIILFNVFVLLFLGKNKKMCLWITCYAYIAAVLIIYVFLQNMIGEDKASLNVDVSFIPFVFFGTLFIFTMMPDFRPKIFLPYAVLYLIAVEYIILRKEITDNGLFSLQTAIFITFVIIMTTKILLYNSKVNTFVNTHKINSLNDQLKNYNENLEEMVNKKTKTIVELKNAVMETIADLVERRDDVTGGHISRTSAYLKIFMDILLEKKLYSAQTTTWNIEQMILSAQLHDVGKISIDDNILRKPGKLDADEFNKMKKHTIFGGEIIKEIQEKTVESDFLNYAHIFAVYHHEKWNGSGYPYGLSAEDIPLPARIMAIIDVYDALVSERPYKKPFTHEEAVKIIKDESGSHFDPALVELFVSVSDKF